MWGITIFIIVLFTYIDNKCNDGGGYYMGSSSYGYGKGFALIVVLFILLIIVGAAYVGYGY